MYSTKMIYKILNKAHLANPHISLLGVVIVYLVHDFFAAEDLKGARIDFKS